MARYVLCVVVCACVRFRRHSATENTQCTLGHKQWCTGNASIASHTTHERCTCVAQRRTRDSADLAMKVMYDDYAIVFNMGMFDETPPQKCVESICTLSAFTKELQERTFAFWWQLAILFYTLLGHARLHAKERH